MIGLIGDLLSFSGGIALVVFGGMALIAFLPKRWPDFSDPRDTLSLAICLGFIAAVGNTVYWQVLFSIALWLGLTTVEAWRAVGDYLDLIFKGGAALSGVLHITALHQQLTKDERRRWHWLEMPWHPHRRACLQKLLRKRQ